MSSGSPCNHLASFCGITGIQILVFGLLPSKNCQQVALKLHSSQGLSSLIFSSLKRKKMQADEFCEVSISLLWEFVVSDLWRKLLWTIKAMISFPCYFGQKDILEFVGVREKTGEQVPVWAYMQLPFYLVFLLSFSILSLAFQDISQAPVCFLSSSETQSHFHQ